MGKVKEVEMEMPYQPMIMGTSDPDPEPRRKYLVTVATLTYQDYIVEADSEDGAREKVLAGDCESYGYAQVGGKPVITNIEPTKEVNYGKNPT